MLIAEPIKRRSFDEEAALIEDAKKNPGGDAEATLLNQFLPSLYSIAKAYFDYNGKPKIEALPTPEDLVQESFEPFRNALRDYDVSRGYRFHTVLQTYVRQHLDNKKKEEKSQKANPSFDIVDPETGEKKMMSTVPISLDEPAKGRMGPGGGSDELGEKQILDFISDTITSRPDWQMHYKTLVQDVEKELNSEKKKDVFRKLLEHGLYPKYLKKIREELGLKPSELSNILGRDIYPTVMKVVKLNER